MSNEKNARIWEETVTIPTYPTLPPDSNPMFFENRINQGASGRIYPNPITDRLTHEGKSDQDYQAVFLENEYIQLMVLPRFGGRIHAALDKTNGYDFVYRQNVIKPALIGLFGSWLSGGMEFNWPLHHRPSTFMPVEYKLEESEDGAVTVWLSEHEPMNRMKGMVGICVYPDKAYFELKVQLFNRTPLPQPFLWWVNTGVKINDDFQLIFPPDVESVTFHSRAYMADYPVARQIYAGLDWTEGVDISWPKNVNQATSYFANPSKFEFFGSYDHGEKAGIIHVANRHISPGKKLFTWGTGDFGRSWQTTLTDEDGPYVELMASSYSDNQPDFTWMQPYETKQFSQIWYPIQGIGLVKNANEKVAVNLEPDFVGVCTTESFPGARVVLTIASEKILDEVADLAPGKPFTKKLTGDRGRMTDFPVPGQPSSIVVYDSRGDELISYALRPPKNESLPETAQPPKLPHEIESLEELFLTGLHVEQYLHTTLDPAIYWERALELDSTDSRSNNALGRLRMRRGDFSAAEKHFSTAIQTLTRYNFNPWDGEPHYNLGLALAYQGNFDEAYEHFYKSTWSYAQRSAGYFALAQIDMRRGDYAKAIDHLDRALVTNAHHNKARALKAAALRKLGDTEAALQTIRGTLDHDPLDLWANRELALLTNDSSKLNTYLRGDVQNYLDLAFDYANAGLFEEASKILNSYCHCEPPSEPKQSAQSKEIASAALPQVRPPRNDIYPMVYYALGYFAAQMGDTEAAAAFYCQGANQPPDYCFPVRMEEQIVLEAALTTNPHDGRAAYYLGNLHYDKRQYDKAIATWKIATENEPSFSIPWRNLGIALYNKRRDKDGARHCYNQALAANPEDPRLLMEMDQLLQRLGASQEDRLAALEKQSALVSRRDDLSITFAELYCQTGQPEKALEILTHHEFHAWEGGEGGAAGQYAFAQALLGQKAADDANLEQALQHFQNAQTPLSNLGVGRGMSMYDVLAWFKTAETLEAMGDPEAAQTYYQKIVDAEVRFSRWGGASPLTYYAALAFTALGQPQSADEKLQTLQDFAQQKLESDDKAGFFTSKPTMVVFDDDPAEMDQIQGHYLMGLAYLGQDKPQEAAASFKSVLNLDPHNWWVKFQLRSIPNE